MASGPTPYREWRFLVRFRERSGERSVHKVQLFSNRWGHPHFQLFWTHLESTLFSRHPNLAAQEASAAIYHSRCGLMNPETWTALLNSTAAMVIVELEIFVPQNNMSDYTEEELALHQRVFALVAKQQQLLEQAASSSSRPSSSSSFPSISHLPSRSATPSPVPPSYPQYIDIRAHERSTAPRTPPRGPVSSPYMGDELEIRRELHRSRSPMLRGRTPPRDSKEEWRGRSPLRRGEEGMYYEPLARGRSQEMRGDREVDERIRRDRREREELEYLRLRDEREREEHLRRQDDDRRRRESDLPPREKEAKQLCRRALTAEGCRNPHCRYSHDVARSRSPPGRLRSPPPIPENNGNNSSSNVEKFKELCHAWSKGKCNASRCNYTHDMSAPRKMCFRYAKTQTCDVGDDCIFSHGDEREVNGKRPGRPGSVGGDAEPTPSAATATTTNDDNNNNNNASTALSSGRSITISGKRKLTEMSESKTEGEEVKDDTIEDEEVTPGSQHKTICQSWLRGECANGADCTFRHAATVAAKSALLREEEPLAMSEGADGKNSQDLATLLLQVVTEAFNERVPVAEKENSLNPKIIKKICSKMQSLYEQWTQHPDQVGKSADDLAYSVWMTAKTRGKMLKLVDGYIKKLILKE